MIFEQEIGWILLNKYKSFKGSSAKQITIPLIRRELGLPIPEKEPRILEKSYNPRYCACCQKKSMVSIQRLPKRGPPKAVLPSIPIQF